MAATTTAITRVMFLSGVLASSWGCPLPLAQKK